MWGGCGMKINRLDTAQIESLGWREIGHLTYTKKTDRGELILIPSGDSWHGSIERVSDYSDPKCLYSGNIWNYEQLMQIERMIGITDKETLGL